jgi:SPOR domain
MRWISAIVLRLSMGLVIGLTGLVTLLFYLSPGIGFPAMPVSILLFIPIVFGLGLAFLLIDGMQSVRWKKHWNRLLEDSGELPYTNQQSVRKALRSFSGLATLPAVADRRVLRFSKVLATKMLQKQVREPWAWGIYLLAWSHIRQNSSLLDETRAALKSCDTLNEAAWRVGLALLKERRDEFGLAIRLAGESMTRELSSHPPEQLAALEYAWLTAYREMPDMRSVLLPPLTRRFLATKRRDDVAGRIYVDAFVNLSASHELIGEMKRTADALETTGGEPELIANLRALAIGDESESQKEESPAQATFAPFPENNPDDQAFDLPQMAVQDAVEHVEISADTSQPVQFAFEGQEEGEDNSADDLIETLHDRPKSGSRKWIWAVIGVVFVAIALIIVLSKFDLLGTAENADTKQLAAERSVMPYTLQVSALPTRARAVELIRSLNDLGLDSYLVTTTQNDKTWYRVHLGHFASTEEANAAATQLLSDNVIDDYYVARFESGEIPSELLQPDP